MAWDGTCILVLVVSVYRSPYPRMRATKAPAASRYGGCEGSAYVTLLAWPPTAGVSEFWYLKWPCLVLLVETTLGLSKAVLRASLYRSASRVSSGAGNTSCNTSSSTPARQEVSSTGRKTHEHTGACAPIAEVNANGSGPHTLSTPSWVLSSSSSVSIWTSPHATQQKPVLA